MLLPALGAAREKARQISCASNLKQVGTGFSMFTLENDDKLPRTTDPNGANGAGDDDPATYLDNKYGAPEIDNPSGYYANGLAGTAAANFEELRRSGVLKDAKVFRCPSSADTAGSAEISLNSANCSYGYAFGMTAGSSSIMGMPDSGVTADASLQVYGQGNQATNNHESYGNVLYLDTHVSGAKGPKWAKQSGYWTNVDGNADGDVTPVRLLAAVNGGSPAEFQLGAGSATVPGATAQ
ncbi:DUF1559 domain-containing protein [Lentisphaerae bacterium WC36]|nr:DUF1559 domain-containing protein [Lentisphaerae bacterium WC36]